MKELSPESRALLAEARRAEHLTPADKTRIRSKLTQRLGAGLALGTALTATATVAEAAHPGALAAVMAWLPAAAKVVSVIAITGAVSVGVVKVTRTSSRAAPALAPVAAAPVNRAPRTQASVTSNVAVTSQTSSATNETSPDISEADPPSNTPSQARSKHTLPNSAAPSEHPQARPVSDPPSSPSEPVASDYLSRQVVAIRTARAAIRDGDPQTALTVLEREIPAGQAAALAPEAALARVAAYCRLGQNDAARRTAEQFLLQYPNSPLASRVRDSCAGVASAHR